MTINLKLLKVLLTVFLLPIFQISVAASWCAQPRAPHCVDSIESSTEWKAGKCKTMIEIYEKELQGYLDCIKEDIKKQKDETICKFHCKMEGKEYCSC